jgi:hypothetical protein
MRKRFAALAMAVAALAGCGGSSSSALTHAQLVSKANSICAQRNAKIAALPRSLANPRTAKGTATLLGDVLAIDKPLIAKLHTLKPPAADKTAWDQALAINDRTVQILTQARAAAEANDQAKFTQVSSQLTPLAQKLKHYEVQFGLTQCEKQPVPSKA